MPRERYKEFRSAWDLGQRGRDAGGPFLSAEAIDRVLHDERLESGGVKRAYVAVLSSLPDGAMIDPTALRTLSGTGGSGPGAFPATVPPSMPRPRPRLAVLTPRSIVRAIRAGFVPQVHETAGRR